MIKLIFTILLSLVISGCYSSVAISDINAMHKYCNSKNTTLVQIIAYSSFTDSFMCSDGVKTVFKD